MPGPPASFYIPFPFLILIFPSFSTFLTFGLYFSPSSTPRNGPFNSSLFFYSVSFFNGFFLFPPLFLFLLPLITRKSFSLSVSLYPLPPSTRCLSIFFFCFSSSFYQIFSPLPSISTYFLSYYLFLISFFYCPSLHCKKCWRFFSPQPGCH